jgi:hypothetical protein
LNWKADPALIGQGAAANASILLSDVNGHIWAVTMTDAEQIQIEASAGQAELYFLNDTTLANTSWQLGVTTAGNLTFNEVTYNAAYPSEILFSTTPSQYGANLQIVNGRLTISGTLPANEALYLNDTVLPNTSWQLIVNSATGQLIRTQVAYNAPYPTSLVLATNPSQLNAVISVANGALQEIQPYPSARDPQICLRWSDDGGKTWSDEHWESAGQAGTFKTRAHWHRLGRSRDRVYEMVLDDPIDWRVIDAYLDADPGFKTTERLNKNLAKMA